MIHFLGFAGKADHNTTNTVCEISITQKHPAASKPLDAIKNINRPINLNQNNSFYF
jgi:hypothetical protein